MKFAKIQSFEIIFRICVQQLEWIRLHVRKVTELIQAPQARNTQYHFSASKGFWSEMLGVGNFYYELGVQVIEVCMAANHRNGGKSHPTLVFTSQ